MSKGQSVRWTGNPPHYELHCQLCGEERAFPPNYLPVVNAWPAMHGWRWSKEHGWVCEACGVFIESLPEGST